MSGNVLRWAFALMDLLLVGIVAALGLGVDDNCLRSF